MILKSPFPMRASLLAFVTFTVIFVAEHVRAKDDFPCDDGATRRAVDAGLKFAYQPRPPSPYCDGMTPQFNKGELHLVSVTLGNLQYVTSQSKLLITIGPDNRTGIVKIRGQDKRPGASYRLDGRLPLEGLSVDLTAVLHPAGIEASNLGLVAWRETDGRIVYQPILAGETDSEAEVKVVVSATDLVIAAAYEFCTGSENGCLPQVNIEDIQPLGSSQGSLFSIDIPLGAKSSEVWVKVSTLSPGNKYGAVIIPLWLPGRDE